MKRLRIYPYKMASESATLIRKAIKGSRKVFAEGAFRPSSGDLILCWGATAPTWGRRLNGCVVLNHWDATNNARNKINAHRLFAEKKVRGPQFTITKKDAQDWLKKGYGVVSYNSPTGQGGQGVRFTGPDSPNKLPDAALYTRYIKKQAEYRVHVFRGKVIDVTQKARSSSAEQVDNQIRNIDHGWIFKRHGITVPKDVETQAIAAVAALGLDFGGVDVIWNDQGKKAFVLEVNTAPGIEGTTLERYITAIKEALK